MRGRRGRNSDRGGGGELVVGSTVTCPHCWEAIEVTVDLSAGDQSYIEDCSVCCRPITLSVLVRDGELAGLSAEAAE
jgi:Cysteine-rich CPXCG